MSVRARLILVIVTMTSISALAVTAIGISALRAEGEAAQQASRQALRQQATDQLSQLTDLAAAELDLTLDQVAQSVRGVASYVTTTMSDPRLAAVEGFWPAEEHMFTAADGQYMNGAADAASVFVPATRPITPSVSAEIERTAYLDLYIPKILESDPDTVAVYFGTPNDVVRYYPNIELGKLVPPDFAVTGRPWYTDAVSTTGNPDRDVRWTDPYADATGRGLVTTAAIPVYSGSRLLGVVGFDITLQDLRAKVEGMRFLQSGYHFVMDPGKRAIALPDQGYQDLLGRPRNTDEVGPDLSGSPANIASILARMANGERGLETVQLGGRELLVAFAPLSSTGWSLGSVVETASILQPADALAVEVQSATQRLVFNLVLPIILVILAAVVIAGYWLAQRFARPITQMAEAARLMGEGKLDVEVPPAGGDEIGALAWAFNSMVRQVRETVGSLEERVASRTRDLERQALQMQTTADIARLVAEVPNPEALLGQALDLVQQRFGFYHASVFLLDETGTWADLAASTGEAGRRLMARGHRLAVGSASLVGWVTSNRLPRVSNDVANDPFHFKNPMLPETRSEMATPLTAGGHLLGVLDVQSRELDAFSPDDVRAMEAVAHELASAMDNARRLRETQDELEKVDSLVRGRARESWSRLARAGQPTLLRIGGDETREPSPLADEVARTGGTAFSPDGREIAVPVVVRGETVATIAARRPDTAPAWEREDIGILEAVAGQIGLSLENARQYAEEQRRVTELEAVNRVSQAVSQLLRLDSLFKVVHAQVSQILPGVDLAIGRYDSTNDSIEYPFVVEAGEVGHRPSTPMGDDLAGEVIRMRQPLMLTENVAQQAAAMGARFPGPAPASWLGVPLLVGDMALGVLIIQDPDNEGRFGDDDLALLTTVAAQVATAMQNDRLLDQTQRAARRERLIHEITSKLRRSPDMRSILDTTARELGRALNATHASVRLGPETIDTTPPATSAPPAKDGSR
ncbi:MAG TPA: GAF domain-containing protein [Anaerolineales bacterium]|nr:GAF domain-containing protein [Anaerolineales bacterium]